MPRQVELIGAAWGLGGPEPGCAEAPAVLIPLLVEQLQRCGVPVRAGPILSPTFTERRKQLAVSKLCGLLASAVAESLRRGRLPCVLGGDHSLAGGALTGVAPPTDAPRRPGWVAAHTCRPPPRRAPTRPR